jgi:hypothetical protein
VGHNWHHLSVRKLRFCVAVRTIFYGMCWLDRLPDLFYLDLLIDWLNLKSFLQLIQSHRVEIRSTIGQYFLRSFSTDIDLSLTIVVTEDRFWIAQKQFSWFGISRIHKSLVKSKSGSSFSNQLSSSAQIEFFELTRIDFLDIYFAHTFTMPMSQELALFLTSLPNVTQMRIFEKNISHVETDMFELPETSLAKLKTIQTNMFLSLRSIENISEFCLHVELLQLTSIDSYWISEHLRKIIFTTHFNLQSISITMHVMWDDTNFVNWLRYCPNIQTVEIRCHVTDMDFFNMINNSVKFVTYSSNIELFSVRSISSSTQKLHFLFHKSKKFILHGFKVNNSVLEFLFLNKGNYNEVSLRNAFHYNCQDNFKASLVHTIVRGSIMTLNMLHISKCGGLVSVSNRGVNNVELLPDQVIDGLILCIALRLSYQVSMEDVHANEENEGYFNFFSYVAGRYEDKKQES